MVTKIGENSSVEEVVFERNNCAYENLSDRFLTGCRNFERQYAPFYNTRLRLFSKSLHKKAKEKWGSEVAIKKMCDVSVGEDVVIIGTLCKHMELRPSILKEISEEHHLIPQPVGNNYTDDQDFLILEDDIQRITLKGNIDCHIHVTGIVVAVLGSEQEDGKFEVIDVCYSSVAEPMLRPVFEVNRYVMIVSGLGVGSTDVMFPLQLLVDYVTGLMGETPEQQRASNLVRLIIAGNSINERSKDKDFSNKTKYLIRKSKAASVDAIKSLDDIFAELAASVDIDLMPGEFDPANHLMPQQPLHRCMFPKAAKFSSFHSVTNPYNARIEGLQFLGTSGQNIKDIVSYSKLDDVTEIMENTLKWGHLSPTAPDTLNCYPYANEDPFMITECPHVYFAGNMPKLSVKKYGSADNPVTIVTIPKFSETFTAVMINLRNLSVEPFEFCNLDF